MTKPQSNDMVQVETKGQPVHRDDDDDENAWIPLTPPTDEKHSRSIGLPNSGKDTALQGSSQQRGIFGGNKLFKGSTKRSHGEDDDGKRWYLTLALFGDSTVALALSGLLFVVALALSAYVDDTLPLLGHTSHAKKEEVAYRNLGPTPAITPPIIYEMDAELDLERPHTWVSNDLKSAFQRDGVIAVRGLIDRITLDALDSATMRLIEEQRQKNEAKAQKDRPKVLTGRKPYGSQFYTVRPNAIFLPGEGENVTSAFVAVAMMSAIPKIASNLLLQSVDEDDDTHTCAITTTNGTVRILRDIFLAKDEDPYICGWHVDDVGFWPALADAPGVNAWIALDDMPIENGGGFALAVGSHTGTWRHEAYALTGSTHSFPNGGFKSSSDILQNRPGNGTCNIKDTAPHLHRRMEDTKRIYDIQKGDVIFHDRWLFHRTVPFERSVLAESTPTKKSSTVYRRYSIRYGPGSSTIPPGFGTEPSVISLEQNGGKTADEVAQDDAAWYPKVFPKVEEFELDSMRRLALDRLPTATEKSEDRKRLIRPRRNRQH